MTLRTQTWKDLIEGAQYLVTVVNEELLPTVMTLVDKSETTASKMIWMFENEACKLMVMDAGYYELKIAKEITE